MVHYLTHSRLGRGRAKGDPRQAEDDQMTIIYNRPKCYGSEWEAYVDDEASSRGIDPKDWQALEALEEELETKAQDHFDQGMIEANEQFDL